MFVLVFWGIVGTVAAGISALVLRAITSKLTKGENAGQHKSSRDKALKFAVFLPFACLMWAGLVFVFKGAINAIYLHRDIGVGDSSYCPLPNGYSIIMIDVDDQGTVYNPKTQLSEDSVTDKEDAVSGVRELQVDGVYLFGAADSKYSEHFAQAPTLDRFFILDTRTGTRKDFTTEVALQEAVANLGIKLRLEPIAKVYGRYRFTWFDIVAALFLGLPPAVAVGFLARSIFRLRRLHRDASGETGVPLSPNQGPRLPTASA